MAADRGTYQLVVETPVTPAANGAFGIDVRIVRGLVLNFGVEYGQACRGYRVTDTVSGQSGTIDPLSPFGPELALAYRF